MQPEKKEHNDKSKHAGGRAVKPIGPFPRPEGASEQAVISDVGATEPTIEFGGDGVTPLEEFNEKMEPLRKEQAAKDKERREKAVEEAGVIQTPAKGKAAHGKTI